MICAHHMSSFMDVSFRQIHFLYLSQLTITVLNMCVSGWFMNLVSNLVTTRLLVTLCLWFLTPTTLDKSETVVIESSAKPSLGVLQEPLTSDKGCLYSF